MKKIVKLTESDLMKIVKRILSEQSDMDSPQQETLSSAFDKVKNEFDIKLDELMRNGDVDKTRFLKQVNNELRQVYFEFFDNDKPGTKDYATKHSEIISYFRNKLNSDNVNESRSERILNKVLNEGLFGLGKEDKEAKKLLSLVQNGDVEIEKNASTKPPSSGFEYGFYTDWLIGVSPEDVEKYNLSPYYNVSLSFFKPSGLKEQYLVHLTRRRTPQDKQSDKVKANLNILEKFLKELGGMYKPSKLKTN